MKAIITGACGRLGKMNIKVVHEDPETEIVGALESPGVPFIGMDAGECAGIGVQNIPIVDDIYNITEEADFIIDFTSTQALEKNLEYAVNKNVAMVIGTTGVDDSHKKMIADAAISIPIIWAPNFSIGINLLSRLSKIAGEILKDSFDVEIIESHHRMKKDAPSGTALKLLESVNEVYKTEDIIYGREGMVGRRPSKQIGIHAIRGGDIVGDHTILFAGLGERIELTHKASTIETFSRGALRAAKYILKNGKGLYTMDDVLGFKG